MDTKQVGDKVAELCRQGKNMEAVDTLYDKDIVSVEAQGMPEMPATQQGLDAIRGKNKWWVETNEVHSAETKGPFVNGDRFTLVFKYDFTPRSGPRQGQRTTMDEVGVYTVRDGKVVREEFFY